MKKFFAAGLTAMMALSFVLTGCSSSTAYKDGTYTGTYVNTEGKKSTCEVTITIKDGKIADVKSVEKDDQDKVKDENYGKEAGDKLYAIAQKAVAGAKQYPEMLVKSQDLSKIDAVAGATTSFKSFKAAAEEALKQARK